MAVTDVGTDTEEREKQEPKAEAPMAVTEVGMDTKAREVQE